MPLKDFTERHNLIELIPDWEKVKNNMLMFAISVSETYAKGWYASTKLIEKRNGKYFSKNLEEISKFSYIYNERFPHWRAIYPIFLKGKAEFSPVYCIIPKYRQKFKQMKLF